MSNDTIGFIVVVISSVGFFLFYFWFGAVYLSEDNIDKRYKKGVEKNKLKEKKKLERSDDYWGDF